MVTMFLASVLGWYLVIFGLFLFFRRDLVQSVIADLIAERGVFFLTALITLLLGLMMVISHNHWVMGWPVVVTLLAWLTLISGLIRLFCPEFATRMASSFLNEPMKMNIAGIIFFLIGLFLLFHVYRAYF